jgi:hypothetical protein
VVSGRETLLAQNRDGLRQVGIDDKTVETYCKALEDTFDAATEGLPLPSPVNYDLPVALKLNLQQVQAQLGLPYLRYFIKLDVSNLLGAITIPVLALNGTKDTQVDCERNLGALERGLLKSGKNKIQAMEGLNHLFQHCTTGLATEYPQIEETFSQEALTLMGDWLESLK